MSIPARLPGVPLFAPGGADRGWRTANDTVMGGVSSSRVTVLDNGHLRFEGELSLANNGGFVSMRSAPQDWDLSDTVGLLFVMAGDGRPYDIRLQANHWQDGVFYNGAFQTIAREWQTHYVPYAAMAPRRRGRQLDLGPLDPTNIASVGILCSDKREGRVRLNIAGISAVTPKTVRTSGLR